MPPPEGKDGILRIVETMNYLDQFIKRKADVQKPITQFIKQNVDFKWDVQQQIAFEKTKISDY